jgi:cobalt/nickel transport system permease protein
MLYVDEFVYTNKLRNSHPLERFIFAFVTLIIGILINNPLINLIIVTIMLSFLIYWAKIPSFVVVRLMLIPMGFLVLGVVTIAISISFSPNDMLAYIPVGTYYLGITFKSLNLAISTMLRALSSISCLYFLALTTPMIELIYVIEILKMPNIVTELMILVYRFIFIFIETAFNIYTAQSSRWGYCNFKRSIYSLGILFANLWGKAFLKSKALFISLLSRGYENKLQVLNPKYRFSKVYIITFGIIDLLLIIMAFI